MSDHEIIRQVTELVRLRGVRQAREATGLAPESLLRIAAGLPVRRGTLALAAQRLEARATPPQLGEGT